MTPDPSNKVAVLGTGAIGNAVVRTLLASGHQVLVWNRTPARTSDAVAAGAELATTAAEAVRASRLTLVCVTDHPAAKAILETVPPIVDDQERTVVLLTTGTPAEASAMHRLLDGRRLGHLDAGVQTAPGDIGGPDARFFLAGDRDAFDRHRSVLEMLGRVRWVGPDPTGAAVWDLALFGLWYDAQLGLLRALELTRDAGVDPRMFAEAAAAQLAHVVNGASATADEVVTGDHPPGPASLSEHLPLLGRLNDARREARTGDGGLPAAEQLVGALVASGAGGLGLSAVVDSRLVGRASVNAG